MRSVEQKHVGLAVVLLAILSLTGCQPRLSEGDAKALAEAKVFLTGGGDVNARDEDNWTKMRHAVWNNHLATMRFLIANGTNLRERGRYGHYLLHATALRGHLEAMKILVEHGVEIDAALIGYTALHLAAWEGSIDTVKFLVQHKANVNAKNTHDITPIFFAATSGSYEVVEFLILRGASATATTSGGGTPLMMAAGGHWPAIRAFGENLFCLDPLENLRENIVIRPDSLHKGDYGKVVRLLVKNGAKVDRFAEEATSLHRACLAGNLQAVEALLELGAEPSVKTGDNLSPDLWQRPGCNALDCAVWCGVRYNPQGGKLVDALIRAGAKVNQHDGTGKTPLHNAVENLHVDAIKVLLKARADINGVDKKFVGIKVEIKSTPPYYRHNVGKVHYGQTPLFTALTINIHEIYLDKKLRAQKLSQRMEVVKLLLDKGADTAAKLPDGATPLHAAVFFGSSKEVIELLFSHGADINATDNELATPLHYATLGNIYVHREITRPDLVRMLLRKGASLTARTKGKKMTPLDWAICSSECGEPEANVTKEIIKILQDATASEEQDE